MESNRKYIIKFNILGLSVRELRNFKIDMLESNEITEYETMELPRIPVVGEKVMFNKIEFEVKKITNQYYGMINGIINKIDIYIESENITCVGLNHILISSLEESGYK